VAKQLLVINDSRERVICDIAWSLQLREPVSGRTRLEVNAGAQERFPVRFTLPAALLPGVWHLDAKFTFSTGEVQEDRFTLHVLPPPAALETQARIALFDPKGETAVLLRSLRIRSEPVEAGSDLSDYDMLIVGKAALDPDIPAPDIQRVRDGLKVIVFEQTSTTLERRFGFRVQEYGLRQVFPRVPDHSILAGVSEEHLGNWRGESTLLPPQLSYEMRPRHGPTVSWCGLPVTRLWRCGNRGTVASVLIEKPVRGDFLPILDGGYGLQYSPLLEYREGLGMAMFCQLDVTGRTGVDPAGDLIVRNLVRYMADWEPTPRRSMTYVGEADGRKHFESLGITSTDQIEELSPDHVLVVGRGGARDLAGRDAAVAAWRKAGGRLLVLGLDGDELRTVAGIDVATTFAEYLSTSFTPAGLNSVLAGIGPADLHARAPRIVPLVTDGADLILGNGVLAQAHHQQVVICQVLPWDYGAAGQMNLKRTHRRLSFTLSRMLANLGVSGSTPLLARFQQPPAANEPPRWTEGFYLDQPEEWDDPYRFFRW
jgi:hypothetical protein